MSPSKFSLAFTKCNVHVQIKKKMLALQSKIQVNFPYT